MVERREFSRLLELSELVHGSLPFDIRAEPQEREAVARRLEIPAIARLRAEGVVEGAGSGVVRVRGRLEADVTQQCVVTLEPVPNTVTARFERLFVRDGRAVSAVVVDPEAPDLEPLPAAGLDIGEIVVEELALALEPYPRGPGADAFLARYAGGGEPGEGEDESGPFARLARARPKG
ncbi:hypothetical protein HRbin40_00676 [bacterium HR40]|nr:hypothetical protein HRbin40_00676 [bacterium HR40]